MQATYSLKDIATKLNIGYSTLREHIAILKKGKKFSFKKKSVTRYYSRQEAQKLVSLLGYELPD